MPKKNNLKKFLERQAMIESSGGTNVQHPEIKDPSSMHYGASAIGKYAFMPNTVREVQNRYRLSGLNDPELQAISEMDDEQMKASLEANPELQEKIAEYLAERTLNRMGGDEQMANYAWQYGHNLSPDKIKKKDYLKSDRAKKYADLLKQEEKQAIPVKKASIIAPVQTPIQSVQAEPNEFDLGLPDQAENLKRLDKLLQQYRK